MKLATLILQRKFWIVWLTNINIIYVGQGTHPISVDISIYGSYDEGKIYYYIAFLDLAYFVPVVSIVQ